MRRFSSYVIQHLNSTLVEIQRFTFGEYFLKIILLFFHYPHHITVTLMVSFCCSAVPISTFSLIKIFLLVGLENDLLYFPLLAVLS